MNKKEYWKQRLLQLEESQNKKGLECYEEIETQYRRAQREIEGKLSVWYQRLASNNGISMQEARKMLSGRELEELKWDVEEYIHYGKKNAVNGMWERQLENASARYHISYLEALKIQTQQSLEVMFGNQLDSIDMAMRDIYREGYYKMAYEIQKGVGVGWDFALLDERQISKVIRKPWALDGKNFSDRIWGNREKLVKELHAELSKNIILGSDPQKAIDTIAKKMDVSKNNAGRLIMTEKAFFSSASQRDIYKELGVDGFEVVATLDSVTSEICRDMDGRHFPESQWEIGVTAPPFHVNCRTTTIPYFEDDFGEPGERAARGENGKTYYVPANMTYKEWQKSFVEGDKFNLQESLPNGRIDNKSGVSVYTKKLAIDRLKKEYAIAFKDSRKYAIDEKLLSNSVSWIDDFSQKYPVFMKKIKNKLPLIQNQPASKMKGKVGSFSYYAGSGKVVSIELNGAYFSDYDKMQQYVEKCVASKWTVSNAQPHKTFIHEFGHYVSHSMKGITGNASWEHVFIDECIREFKKQVPEYQYNSYVGMGDYVSRYGATKECELFAEAFAEYYGGGTPRAFAKIFGQKLDKLMKGVK